MAVAEARALIRALPEASAQRETLGHKRLAERVLDAVKLINESSQSEVTVRHIALFLGLNERSLLRAFDKIIGMGPKRYLLLRQLNNVREMLFDRPAVEQRVTHTMMDCGLEELGRAAGLYKTLFGEIPSVTVKRRRLIVRR